MFADYTTLVLRDYLKKRASGKLSLGLLNPSPGKLKEACVMACRDRYDKKDEEMLKAFFGPLHDKSSCAKAIEFCDINKFRPLVNYLKESTGGTMDKNVELLAWLLDYKDRPYEFGKKYDISEKKPEHTEQTELPPEEKEEDKIFQQAPPMEAPAETTVQPPAATPAIDTPIVITRPSRTFPKKTIWIAAVLIPLAILGIYRMVGQKTYASTTGLEKCMYWAGDHYQPISCNEKAGEALVIGLDSFKLNHFKKITNTDTITQHAKGQVWYVKVNGNIEFYTSEGFHPIYSQLRLRPITAYIIYKYVHDMN